MASTVAHYLYRQAVKRATAAVATVHNPIHHCDVFLAEDLATKVFERTFLSRLALHMVSIHEQVINASSHVNRSYRSLRRKDLH